MSHSQWPGERMSRRNPGAGAGRRPGACGVCVRGTTGKLSPGQAARLLRVHVCWARAGGRVPPHVLTLPPLTQHSHWQQDTVREPFLSDVLPAPSTAKA